MSRNINLKRAVDVSCWRVVGQVARASKRAELIPILLRVRDQGQSNAEDIAAHLFFEARSRKAVAERLLRIAATYRLLEESRGSYALTGEGSDAIESEQVFVPEHGTWTVWASDVPLLGSRVLRVEAWQEPSAYDEVWGKDRDAERVFEQLPGWLSKVVGHVQRPCGGDGHSLRIDALEGEGEAVSADATLSVEWAVGAGRLQVSGSVGSKKVQTDLDPPVRSHPDVWRELLEHEGIWSNWDNTREALLVGFDDTEDPERESMTRTLRIGRPRVDGLGVFDAIAISGVGLAARSQADAERWAKWRLESRIQDYATQRRMTEWARAASEPFTEHRIDLPNRGALAGEAWKAREELPSPRTWHLVAAEDWRLR